MKDLLSHLLYLVTPPSHFRRRPQVIPIEIFVHEESLLNIEWKLRSILLLEKKLISNTIKTWEALSDFCKQLPLAVGVSSDNISIYEVRNMHVKYSLIIHNDFHITAQCGLQSVPVRKLICYTNNKLELYSQIKVVLDHLDRIPPQIDNELKQAGQRLLELSINELDWEDETKKKSIEFLCDQLILHGTNRARYSDDAVRNAMNLLLRSRNAITNPSI